MTAGVVTTPAPTIAPTAAVARIDTRVKVYGNCMRPSVEPAEIVLACADYGVLVEGLHWTSWTTASATAVGTLVYNDCTPNCAEGQPPRTRYQDHPYRPRSRRRRAGCLVADSGVPRTSGIQDRSVPGRPAASAYSADLTALLRDFGIAHP